MAIPGSTPSQDRVLTAKEVLELESQIDNAPTPGDVVACVFDYMKVEGVKKVDLDPDRLHNTFYELAKKSPKFSRLFNFEVSYRGKFSRALENVLISFEVSMYSSMGNPYYQSIELRDPLDKRFKNVREKFDKDEMQSMKETAMSLIKKK